MAHSREGGPGVTLSEISWKSKNNKRSVFSAEDDAETGVLLKTKTKRKVIYERCRWHTCVYAFFPPAYGLFCCCCSSKQF
jgi:hypothetical protein